MLKNGIKVVGVDADDDSDQSEWDEATKTHSSFSNVS